MGFTAEQAVSEVMPVFKKLKREITDIRELSDSYIISSRYKEDEVFPSVRVYKDLGRAESFTISDENDRKLVKTAKTLDAENIVLRCQIKETADGLRNWSVCFDTHSDVPHTFGYFKDQTGTYSVYRNENQREKIVFTTKNETEALRRLAYMINYEADIQRLTFHFGNKDKR